MYVVVALMIYLCSAMKDMNAAIAIILALALTMHAQGLSQNCSNYCKYLSNYTTNLRQDCNCISVVPSEGTNNTMSYKPLQFKEIQNPKQSEESTEQNHKFTTSETSAFDKVNPGNNYEENYTKKSENIMEIPLYLDVDLHAPLSGYDKSHIKEVLKHIFEKVRASEKSLSECINLHIYMFSKNNDNVNKTRTNWGQPIYDNLSGSEVLTEIINKCHSSTTVIRESIFKITPQKHVGYNLTFNNNANRNGIISREIFENEDKATECSDVITENMYILENTTILKGEKVIRCDLENETFNTNRVGEQKHNSAKFKPVLLPDGGSRKSVGADSFRRIEYLEKDIRLSKIITKEFSNNTVSSDIDGYEIIPNFDFVTDDTVLKVTEDNEIKADPTDNVTTARKININQSALVQDINGNLYFTFHNSNIPARYIQNWDRELHLAVDGFSLCNEIKKQDENKHIFMKLLCEVLLDTDPKP